MRLLTCESFNKLFPKTYVYRNINFQETLLNFVSLRSFEHHLHLCARSLFTYCRFNVLLERRSTYQIKERKLNFHLNIKFYSVCLYYLLLLFFLGGFEFGEYCTRHSARASFKVLVW